MLCSLAVARTTATSLSAWTRHAPPAPCVDAFRRRELSPVEVLEDAARRIESTSGLGAFLTLCLDEARAEAERCERTYADGSRRARSPAFLLAVKDLFDTAGVRTTYGSGMFAEHVPDRDAVVVERLRGAGAIMVGKTSLFEFAWGITSDNAHFGPCRNPWDERLVAGGSSGGSAVAVATGSVPLALGTDTGRLDPDPGGALRHRGLQAHLRAREPGGRVPAVALARPRRPDGGHARRRRRCSST